MHAGLAAEHGAANVYLLSRRFLEWATPERLAGDFARSMLTAGGSLERELAEAQTQIQLEYEDLAAWLRLKGVSDLGPEPCRVLAELISTGSDSRLGLSVVTKQVEFTHRFEPAGRTAVPFDLLQRLRPAGLTSQRSAWTITENRPALAIVWSGPARDHQSLVAHLEDDVQFSAPAINDLPKLLPTKTDPRLRRLVARTAQHGLVAIDTSMRPRRLARTVLGLTKEDINSASGSNHLIVDLLRTDFGEFVGSFVSQLALGNGKSSDLEVLELDRSNGRLEAEFTLRHRHVWPSIREAQAKLQAALGPDGTGVKGLADRLPDAELSAARTRFREADSKHNEASAKLQAAQKKAREAADHVASKRRELATLASDLARAQTDLRAASDLETHARQEAQAACVAMLELDAIVRLERSGTRSSPEARPRAITHLRKP